MFPMPVFARTRLAPTPSGFLHLGNIFSFLLTWLLARAQNATLILRIDDLDTNRSRIEYLDDIFQTLEWLQIGYDEGASGTADFLENFSQTLFFEKYNTLITKLLDKNLLFPCACSRTELKKQNPEGLHRNGCFFPKTRFEANTKESPDYALRLKVEKSDCVSFEDSVHGKKEVNLAETVGDFVVRRKGGLPAYQIVSLGEDVAKNIDFVVRGEDLIPSTAMQLFLAQKLDLQAFGQTQFWHHRLIEGENGQKLSKSAGATSLKYLRENGTTPAEIYQGFCRQFLEINNPKITKINDLLDFFVHNAVHE